MTNKKNRTELLPPYNDPHRTFFLNMIIDFPDYKDKQKEGYPLRTEEELNVISERYSSRYEGDKTGGITFEEINEEQGKISPIIKLKKPTFRKYIQDDLLPGSIGYTNIGKKRMALFPKDIISHINFLYYFYQVADAKTADALILLADDDIWTVTLLEAIESFSDYDNFYVAVNHYLYQGDGDIFTAVEKALANNPKERERIKEKLHDIGKKFEKIIETEISNLGKELKNKTIKLSEINK